MSDLGDLLELMYRTDEREISVRATVLHWSDDETASRMLERWSAAQGGSRSVLRVRPADETDGEAAETRETFEVWHREPGGLWRVESTGRGRRAVTIVNGSRWWINAFDEAFWTNIRPDGTLAGNVGGGLPNRALETLFKPGKISALLSLQVLGQAEMLGRLAISTSGRLDLDSERGWQVFALGSPCADVVNLLVDVETGIILRAELIADGQPFMLWEMQNITLGQPFEEALFEGPSDAKFPAFGDAMSGGGGPRGFFGRLKLVWMIFRTIMKQG